jgi:hypothetical protein
METQADIAKKNNIMVNQIGMTTNNNIVMVNQVNMAAKIVL